jgi:alpha-beta hydrolase superfamily lysophospholipase
VLNSPWLELQTNWFGRRFASGVVRPLGVVAPKAVLKKKLPTSYPESLHRDHNGEWDFDFEWKPFAGDPIYAGWMRAIRRGHAKVHRGLEVGVPILLLISARTYLARSYDEQCHEADVVVDVRQTARKVHRLTATQHVSVMRFEGAVHDVVLSREPVRERVYAAMGKWLEAYVA